MRHRILHGLGGALAAAILTMAIPASAADLSIGISTDNSAMDPHFHNLTPNIMVTAHMFESLVAFDPEQKPGPGLAVSWKTIDPLTWEFELRKGVKWHDGSDFTAEDVKFTMERIPTVPNSPSSFSIYIRQIKEVIVKGPHTVQFKTDAPYPLMPNELAAVPIISKKNGTGATTEDYNSGKATIGTGPYKLVEWKRGDRVIFEKNSSYWGGAEPWDKVTIRYLTNDAARVAALLAGDVQVIDVVPTADIAKLKQNKDVALATAISNRLIYLHMDQHRQTNSPFVTDKAGKPLEKNPLLDRRVRQAMSRALNREAIVSRVMEGQAIAAGQLLPESFFGTSKNLPVEKFDPEGAKKLLAEAGYPDGFGITLHTPNNRYVNDEQTAQAVAQMLTRVGIATKVDAMPSNIFFSRGSKLEFSFLLAGWGAGSGEVSSPLKSLLGSFDAKKGYGPSNRGRYSNAELDAMIDKALATVDDAERAALLAKASEMGVRDYGVLPLHYNVNTWGTRAGLTYTPRTDERTLAMSVRPARK